MKRHFDIAAGDAATTLRRYAERSGEQLVYVVARVRGVTTNAVHGDFTACDALDQIVHRTGLVVVRDEKTGAQLIRRLLPSKTAPSPASPHPNPPHNPTPMPTKNPFTRLLGALAALAVPLADAQTAPADTSAAAAKADAVQLTPFEVHTDKDVGYVAASSLAGGRADTPLKLTPASISVMTQEFMNDLNITNLTDAAGWTLNMERTDTTAGTFGTFQYNFRNSGGGGSYPTRNYFLFYFNSDSFNTERFEFARGPNALLFGDASLGGISTQLTKQARFNNRSAEARFQVDSYGGWRASVDQMYGKDKFSIRVNGLVQRFKDFQKATFNNSNAIHVAGSYKVSADTQVRAEFEVNAIHTANYRKVYPENVSYWNHTTVNTDTNTILGASPSISGATATAAGIGQVSGSTDYLVYNYGSPAAGVLNYRGNQYRTNGTGFGIPWRGRPDLQTGANFPRLAKDANLRQNDADFFRTLDHKGAYLDHRFSDDWFAQLAYARMDFGPYTKNNENVGNDYRIDVNKYLPTLLPGQTTPSPTATPVLNPNFGKAFADVAQSRQYQDNSVNDVRLLTTYKFAAPKVFDLKQRFALIGGWRFERFEMWQRATRWVNNPLQPNPTNNANRVVYRIYWDDPTPAFVPPSIPGAIFKEVNTGFSSDDERTLKYGQLVSSTTMFHDRLSIIGGLRRDSLHRDVINQYGYDTAGNMLYGYLDPKTLINVPGLHGHENTNSSTKSLGGVFFLLPWVGLSYNYSENFGIPSTGATKIDGSAFKPPVGSGRDIGLKFSLGDRAYATITYYDTKQIDQIISGGNITNMNAIWTNLGYTDADHTNIAYRDTQSITAKGYEFELTANPSRNFRMTLNYSRPDGSIISQREGEQGYLARNQAEWEKGAASKAGDVVNGKTIIDPVAIQTNLQAIKDALNGIALGATNNGTLKYMANAVGTYSFTQGRLKGFSLGGGVQQRGQRKVGSVDAQLLFNTTAPTVAQNLSAAYHYLYVPSNTNVSAFASYDYRFTPRIRGRFQLNVANLLDNDKPQWTSYSVLGLNAIPGGNPRMQVVSGFTQFDPRKFTLTSTFTF